jgi:predicted metallo-beta-lactamase superfamily hydrolase
LICEKIGQNYLDINGKDVLEMPTDSNLTAILDKTKTSKDMVEYHLLNSKDFINSLQRVFKTFQEKGDKLGMGIVCRIMRSILTNMDHRLVENMFSDPCFELILEV